LPNQASSSASNASSETKSLASGQSLGRSFFVVGLDLVLSRARSKPWWCLPPLTRLVGDYRPTAGYSFPAYLTVPLESRSLTSAVCMLVSTSDDALILLTPTRHRCGRTRGKFWSGRGATSSRWKTPRARWGRGNGRPRTRPVQALRDFTGLHIPSTDADNGMVFFPTPAGAT